MAISAPVSLRIPIARGVAPTSGRLQPLDALRGSAMLFVFLSHFANGYFGTIGEHRIEQWVTSVAYVASPTFVLVAGMLLGWMYQARAATFDRFARYLRDRAVFLLSVAHGLFMIAVVPRVWAGAQSLDEVIITDVIGVALLVGPTLVRQLRRRKRLEIALALYVVSWMVVLLTTPTSLAARVVKHTLVGPGPQEVGFWSYGVPILPWLAVYLSGTVLGEWVAIRGAKGLTRDVALRLATLGVGATMLSTTQRAAAVALRHQGGALARLVSHPVVAALSSPWQKVPPGPGYLLFFGGIGLVLAAAVFVAVDLWASSAPVRFL